MIVWFCKFLDVYSRYSEVEENEEYVLIAMGPFLIFLLKTLPSSLPNDAGAGSNDATGSGGGCDNRLVSLSNNRR